jgi:hypothetical protein
MYCSTASRLYTTASLHCAPLHVLHCITPPLHHCITVSSRLYTTPLHALIHCATSKLYVLHGTTALHHCTTAPLHHCITTLHHGISPLHHCMHYCHCIISLHHSTTPLHNSSALLQLHYCHGTTATASLHYMHCHYITVLHHSTALPFTALVHCITSLHQYITQPLHHSPMVFLCLQARLRMCV